MRLVRFLALLLLSATIPADATSEFPRGTVVESVAIHSEPSQTYALYLPHDYSPEKKWPVLYCFDASGRGLVPIRLFRDAAERLGFILVSTNFVKNEQAPEENVIAMRKWWDDTHARLSVDSRRVYAAGFSGGARRAVLLDRIFSGSLAGVILCGAGYPFDIKPDDTTKLDVFMTVGDRDYNYYEMKNLERTLARLPVSFRLEIFDAAHQWPPEPAPHQEWMLFTIPNPSMTSAQVELRWDKLMVPFTIEVDTINKAMESARSAVDDWRAPYQAANFAFTNEMAGDDAMRWIDRSIAVKPSDTNLQLKAKMLAKRGDKKQAIAMMEKAIATGKAAKEPPDMTEGEKLLGEWKGK